MHNKSAPTATTKHYFKGSASFSLGVEHPHGEELRAQIPVRSLERQLRRWLDRCRLVVEVSDVEGLENGVRSRGVEGGEDVREVVARVSEDHVAPWVLAGGGGIKSGRGLILSFCRLSYNFYWIIE